MILAIIGESCVGKTTLVTELNKQMNAEVFTGKDYLRLEKNEENAKKAFSQKLKDAVNGSNIIYVITDSEHLSLLPDGVIKVVLTASLETIKARFATRMHGQLPKPVEMNLELKHGQFDQEPCNLTFNTDTTELATMCEQILDYPFN